MGVKKNSASASNHPPKTKNHESCKVAGCGLRFLRNFDLQVT